MKKSELFFSFLLVPLDFAMIMLAGALAYYIRFAQIATDIRPVIFNLPFNEYLKASALIAISWIMIFALLGLYRIKGSRSFLRELNRVIIACSAGFMLITLLIFVRRELFDSRFIILAGWIFAVIFVSFSRSLIRLFQKYLFKYDVGIHKVILIGDTKTAEALGENFRRKKSGFRVVKKFKDFSLETAKKLEEFLENGEADELIQSDPNLTKAEVLRLYDFADEHHIAFRYAADMLGAKVLRTEVEEIAGIPVVEVKKTTLDGWGRIAKRIFDIIISLVLIIITSPVMLLAAFLIKIDSHGPVFFSKKDDGKPVCRIGQGGKPFKYFKFRSMIIKSDNMRYNELADRNLRSDGPLVKIKEDPRITRVGKFIRKTNIDELPELFLVLKGDMSLVGPRPHLPEEVEKYERHHKKVLTIKPGMTGMAQVSGRSDLSFEEEVKLDVYYIENWSMFTDLFILLKTPLAIFRKRKAI